MIKKPRRSSPEEPWKALEKIPLREEGERVAALSDAELDAALAARGIDARAARARGAALAAKLLARRAKGKGPRS